jgi:hypothetical protein
MSKTSLVITNKKIIDFYSKNKHVDIEKINLLFIDLLNNIADSTINNPSVVNDIMRTLSDQNKDINNIISLVSINSEIYKNDINTFKNICTSTNDSIKNDIENIKLLLTNMTSTFISKIYETKDSYINEFKSLFMSFDNQQILNISSTIEKHNQNLSDKLILLINDIIPKNQSLYFENIISLFKNDINKLFEKNQTSNINIDNISSIIDSKYNILVQNIHEHFLKYISLSEDRLTNNINSFKETSYKNFNIQDTINNELITYLNKHKSSASKGIQGEEILYSTLMQLFPSAEIINTTGKTASGDFILKRNNKPTILFENKLYNINVKKEETDKFFRDINKNKCHGIFMSQQSGIVGKDNFQIDFHDGFILIYIHNLYNEPYKINIAVNIIDILSSKINSIDDIQTTIPKDILTAINNELQTFFINKEKILVSLKDFYKKTTEQLNDFQLPSLENFLSSYYANNKKNIIFCDLCKKFNTDNLRSLARHKHSCKNKKEITTNTSDENNSDAKN